MPLWICCAMVCLSLIGCSPRPTVMIEQGALLHRDTFDAGIGWDTRQQGQVSIGVESGAYRMRANTNQFVMGFGFGIGTFEDTIIEVNANQLSPYENNAYGVACRASIAEGSTNGYLFLIGGDGSASLRIGRVTEIQALIAWQPSDKINQGVASNRLRVMCVGDYLALYANDSMIFEIRDSTYRTGYIGFIASVARGGVIEVAFDDLFIYEGKFAQNRP